MSRIGKKPVLLPPGRNRPVKDGEVKVKGPKGELSLRLVEGVEATVEKTGVVVKPRDLTDNRAPCGGFSARS